MIRALAVVCAFVGVSLAQQGQRMRGPPFVREVAERYSVCALELPNLMECMERSNPILMDEMKQKHQMMMERIAPNCADCPTPPSSGGPPREMPNQACRSCVCRFMRNMKDRMPAQARNKMESMKEEMTATAESCTQGNADAEFCHSEVMKAKEAMKNRPC